MRLSHSIHLYTELFYQIARMHDEVDYRRHLNDYKGQKGNRKQYPAVSVGAELFCNRAIGHQHDYSQPQDFHPLVLCELNRRLGELNRYGVHYPRCKNRVGHCAENYAASSVLGHYDPNNQCDADILRDIKFTKGFQPRTWKNIDWCDNCRTMFD